MVSKYCCSNFFVNSVIRVCTMLLRRILLQAFLVFIISISHCQCYDAEYEVSDDSGEDRSDYTHEKPDYSKYYSVDSSAPPASQVNEANSGFTGFINPSEFSTFFNSPEFGFGSASNNFENLKPKLSNPKTNKLSAGFVPSNDFKQEISEYDIDGFGTQDFFEKAQKEDTQEDAEDEVGESSPLRYSSKPGPNYISHRIPARYSDDQPSDYTNYGLNDKPSKSKLRKSKPKDAEHVNTDDLKENSGFGESDIGFDYTKLLNIPSVPTPGKLLTEAANKAKYSNIPHLYPKLINGQDGLSPYQKYSFQPVADPYGLKPVQTERLDKYKPAPFNPSYDKLYSTAATGYEYQPTQNVEKSILGKQCVKVNKEITDRTAKFENQPMNCYVCKDGNTGAKSEHCSYTSEPAEKSYYSSKTYGDPENYRSKRDDSEAYVNPYEEVKARSHKYYSVPKDFENQFYKTADFTVDDSEGFNFDPKSFINAEAEDKSYSEIQSEELLKNKENCKKVSKKDGVTCTVCKNSKTGGNYESCSYESAPNDKSYAYVRERKFDGNGEEEDAEGSEPNPTLKQKSERYYKTPKEEERDDDNLERDDEEDSNSKLINDEPYDVPRHFVESTQKQRDAGVRGLDPELYGPGPSKKSGKYSNLELDDYHLKLFPQFENEEAEETQAHPEQYRSPYFDENKSKKDVEEVLADFIKKDRSNCKQVSKKGMTCYLCADKAGVQQEECMYVSESRPQSSHLAYHEVQHIKVPDRSAPTTLEEDHSDAESTKRKRVYKKVRKQPSVSDNEGRKRNANYDAETSASYSSTKRAPLRGTTKFTSNSDANVAETKTTKQVSSEIKDKSDQKISFDAEIEDGLSTAETQPAFSKTWGLSLPKYMLDKSEHEKVFDELVSSV